MRSKQTLEPWGHYQIIVWYVLAACKKFITPLKIMLFETPTRSNSSGRCTSTKFRLRIGLKSIYVLLCGRMSQEVSLTLMKWRGKRWRKQHGEIAQSTHDVRRFSKRTDWYRPKSRWKLVLIRHCFIRKNTSRMALTFNSKGNECDDYRKEECSTYTNIREGLSTM